MKLHEHIDIFYTLGANYNLTNIVTYDYKNVEFRDNKFLFLNYNLKKRENIYIPFFYEGLEIKIIARD